MAALTIADVVSRTGVPPATVHYYLRHGLLPRPKRLAPNRFGYDERHVQGLRLIRTLREQRGLALPMIKRILPDLMQLESTEAFVPEMWDRALAPRISRRRLPSTRLLEAAKEAFARKGYDDTNVDEICRAARIAKGSFYRHYRSKEDLFFAVADAAATDVVTLFEEAREGRTLEPPEAAGVLAPFLEPRLTIFLDLFSRSLQGRPGYRIAARTVFRRAAKEIGVSLVGGEPADELGNRALGAAVAELFRGVQEVANTGRRQPARPAL
ncbi:MAG TPA: TetR family transcriptional regulator [Actinomycetota bacterium]|nr:TetR family transcriptional regulator [Actinomycetota bacterium]